jgi:ABC-type sulfate transport system permease component|tara:strand:- start:496 stop:744 length:249 start_codon:yes stop_codon:yes gene_type:complete
MTEIPTWLLFVLVAAIVILFVFNQELNRKVLRIQFDQLQLGIILNKSFMDITLDINNINKGLDNIDIKYDKIKEEVSKTSSR